MKMVFNMSTGEVLEDCQAVQRQRSLARTNTYLIPELRLQEITHDFREDRREQPKLVIADLNAFLAHMS